MDVRQTTYDARYWIEKTYSPDEIAVHFDHHLVAIHPFPNGNDRFSRLIGDLLAQQLRTLHMGPCQSGRCRKTRARYIEALRAADNRDIKPLLLFARS